MDPTVTEALRAWWTELRDNVTVEPVDDVGYGTAFDGIHVWLRQNNDVHGDARWRRVAQALELLAVLEICDREAWSRVLPSIVWFFYVRELMPTRPSRHCEHAMARRCRERLVVYSLPRELAEASPLAETLATLLLAHDAFVDEQFAACRQTLIERYATTRRQREEVQQLIIPVVIHLELGSGLVPIASFEDIRKAQQQSLFTSEQPTARPFRLVKVCVQIRSSDRLLSDQDLLFQMDALRQNDAVGISLLEIPGFADDVTVTRRHDWLQSVLQPSHSSPVRLKMDDVRVQRVRSSASRARLHDTAAVASTLMHAQDVLLLKLQQSWMHESLWPWALYAMFSARATHTFSQLIVSGQLKRTHMEAFNRLTRARNPRALLLDTERLQGVGATISDAFSTPLQASVRKGVVLEAWATGSAFVAAPGDEDSVGAWTLKEDDVFEVLVETARLVIVLVPHVGVCAVRRTLCELSTVSGDAWNLNSHPIRRLILYIGSAIDSDGEEEEDDSNDEADDDEEEEEDDDDEDDDAPCRFLRSIGRPLLSLSLRFGSDDHVDDVLAVLPESCPNLKRLNISGGTLETFESITRMFHQGLQLEALDIWLDALEDSASVSSFASELRDPASAMSQSLREITIIEFRFSRSADELLLREMHLVAKQNHQLHWIAIKVAVEVAYHQQEMVDAIEQLRFRRYAIPMPRRNQLAFLSAVHRSTRRQHGEAARESAMARFSSDVLSLILAFAADSDCATGKVLRRD